MDGDFNTCDAKGIIAACTDDTSIIDEFGPFLWRGPGATAKWLQDNAAHRQKLGITDKKVTLGEPKSVAVEGDLAYVVLPADHTYKLKGEPMKQTAAIWTLTLIKEKAGWKAAAWS